MTYHSHFKAGREVPIKYCRGTITHRVGDCLLIRCESHETGIVSWQVWLARRVPLREGADVLIEDKLPIGRGALGCFKWLFLKEEEAKKFFQEQCGVPIFDWAAEMFPSRGMLERELRKELLDLNWRLYREVRDDMTPEQQERYDDYFKDRL